MKSMAVVSLAAVVLLSGSMIARASTAVAAATPAAPAHAVPAPGAAPVVWLSFVPTGTCQTICSNGDTIVEEDVASTPDICCGGGTNPCPAGWFPTTSSFLSYQPGSPAFLCS